MGGAVQKLQKIVIDGYRDRVKFRFHCHDDLEAAVAGHEPNHIIYPASIEMRKTGSRNVVAKLLSEIAVRLLDVSRSLGLPSGSPKEDAKLVVVESHRLDGACKPQAVFFRRRHQLSRPPLAKIRPGRPAPVMGPGVSATSSGGVRQ